MVLVVHHLQVSQSERVVWLCEELGLDYEIKLYQRDPMFSPKAYQALHPIGAAPVIQDGAVTLAETEACIEYILNIFGSKNLTVKPGADNYADYLYWYFFANGSFQPLVGRLMTLRMLGVEGGQKEHYEKKLVGFLSYMDERLSKVPYLAGQDFSVADIMPVFTLTTMRVFSPFDLSKYQHILAWLKRVTSREGYKSAMTKGDPETNIEGQIQGQAPPMFPALAKRG